jgi:hypothetical protein
MIYKKYKNNQVGVREGSGLIWLMIYNPIPFIPFPAPSLQVSPPLPGGESEDEMTVIGGRESKKERTLIMWEGEDRKRFLRRVCIPLNVPF